MGKLSRLRMLGSGYTKRLEEARSGLNKIGEIYNNHIMDGYPKVEEDNEGIIYWVTPKICRMEFKELTPQQGYIKTMEKFKRVRMDKFINCYIDDKYVVVELP
jgi:hypothetical protein